MPLLEPVIKAILLSSLPITFSFPVLLPLPRCQRGVGEGSARPTYALCVPVRFRPVVSPARAALLPALRFKPLPAVCVAAPWLSSALPLFLLLSLSALALAPARPGRRWPQALVRAHTHREQARCSETHS